MGDRTRGSPSAQFSLSNSTTNNGKRPASNQAVAMEDLFNYLYGYTPLRLVDPKELQRERLKKVQVEKDTSGTVTYCEVCNEKHEGECPMHGPLHSLRKLVTAGQSSSPLENGSVLKFPDEVCLCTSSIPCVRYGVCARKRIPAGTWIGPYEGKLMRPEDIGSDTDTEYMWEVFHDGQVSHYLDGREEANASWMRFVRCARHKKEQNMVVFQYHGCVYYRTVRDILAGQELLVWYDARYSQFMGVPVALSDSGTRGVHPPRDLVAQRNRERHDADEPPAKRHHHTDHAPAQRGRPPLRRAQDESRAKTELNSTSQAEERKEDRRTVAYRGRAAYNGKYSGRTSRDMADDFTWRCNLCFKAFAVREQLEEHQCNGMGKNLVCHHCNQTFSHPVEFRNHVESHANERPFRCGFCSSAFASAALLNQHVRVHLTDSRLVKMDSRLERTIGHDFQF
ncbi:putative histone-lysine N-methyltransferase PRDM6 [Nematostella vectensis]|uniref:putative histone-lysine N-methyltransferase PRDM6 n=1 Tax=Nematostella vectensis TaxID=45351 RepID=UPI00138FECC3|nr:putative histone-lysine N-methyltransferase PRDM6 [Nematostella vectensis]XP_032221189.1 putative histone-lysine N-methyltransferase PRDM6 [Nematostella vectensis]XP_032221190.1 putative histone-lysine N-methyltransferase PRDM6 [Nematostella vectensis]XP_032221191.1 putative histone-lysine N-methyltransferase PRDM6 [Nematostella vectensis]